MLIFSILRLIYIVYYLEYSISKFYVCYSISESFRIQFRALRQVRGFLRTLPKWKYFHLFAVCLEFVFYVLSIFLRLCLGGILFSVQFGALWQVHGFFLTLPRWKYSHFFPVGFTSEL